MSETHNERKRAGQFLRDHGERLPAALRGPLAAVRDGTEIPGTADAIMDFADQWLADSNGGRGE